MKKNTPVSLSRLTNVALTNLGKLIKNCRLERGISQQDLADRINVSRYTVIAIEKGNPKVSIGAAFEAAYIVGVPLMGGDLQDLKELSVNLAKMHTVLPQRAPNNTEDLDDDF